MYVIISRTGIGRIGNFRFKCALGKNGVTYNKVEGDNKTPAGVFPLRFVMYRRDRIKKPKTNLQIYPLKPSLICCDDPKKKKYNKIYVGKKSETESLWRSDCLYNIILVIGYNDSSIVKNKGSAIFMHLTKKNYTSSQGCIALKKKDMLRLLCHNPKKIKIS